MSACAGGDHSNCCCAASNPGAPTHAPDHERCCPGCHTKRPRPSQCCDGHSLCADCLAKKQRVVDRYEGKGKPTKPRSNRLAKDADKKRHARRAAQKASRRGNR